MLDLLLLQLLLPRSFWKIKQEKQLKQYYLMNNGFIRQKQIDNKLKFLFS